MVRIGILGSGLMLPMNTDDTELAIAHTSSGAEELAKKVPGFAPVDVGPLRMARYMEPFTLLIARIAYDGDGGPAIGYRFDEFEEKSEL